MVAVADALISQLLLAVKPLTGLLGQNACLLNGLASEPGFFPRHLPPLLPDDAGSARSERRLVGEVRKSCAMRGYCFGQQRATPMFYGHTQLVHLETLPPMQCRREIRVALAASKGLTLSDEPNYPMPVEGASGNVDLNIDCLRIT
ncbi:MAG: USG-1 protein [Sodalis sp.]|nr:MAG: USG-1 protein [Sodalis sp.]WMQ73319.1 MAG: USG-1 protein [Sodalis sp.]